MLKRYCISLEISQNGRQCKDSGDDADASTQRAGPKGNHQANLLRVPYPILSRYFFLPDRQDSLFTMSGNNGGQHRSGHRRLSGGLLSPDVLTFPSSQWQCLSFPERPVFVEHESECSIEITQAPPLELRQRGSVSEQWSLEMKRLSSRGCTPSIVDKYSGWRWNKLIEAAHI